MRNQLLASLALALSLVPASATAVLTTDRVKVAVNIAAQNTFQHDGDADLQWVQQQNELRAELQALLLRRHETYGPLRGARFSLLYRGRYDSIFDVRSRYGSQGYRRDDFRFPEGKIPREVFLDLDFQGVLEGLGLRIGRQQVVWGEGDLFRSLDVINPLRLDQNGIVGNDFADYREPLWILRATYPIGDIRRGLANLAVEWIGSLNGRPLTERMLFGEVFRIGVDRNNVLTGLRRRNTRSFASVRHPWELSRLGSLRTDAPGEADLGDPLGPTDVVGLTDNRIPRTTFHPDAAMTGVRFSGQTFAGLDFTLNYIWKRSELPGTAIQWHSVFDPSATPGLPNVRQDLLQQAGQAALTPDLDGDGTADGNADLIRRCIDDKEPLVVLESVHGTGNATSACLPLTFWYPWTHIFGATLTYNDFDYTGAIFRLEQSWSTKEPRVGRPALVADRAGEFPGPRDFATLNRRRTGIWRSMVGFDYLRALGVRAARRWPQPLSSFLNDQWFLTAQLITEYDAHARGMIGNLVSPTDRQQHWNNLFTFVMTGFFVNNRLRPWFAAAYDVNAEMPILWLQADWHASDRVSIRLGEVLYLGSRFSESFLFLNKYADRDTLFLRVTFRMI